MHFWEESDLNKVNEEALEEQLQELTPLKNNWSQRSEEMEALSKTIFGFDRRDFISKNLCVPHPAGCGNPTQDFRDEVSKREYSISGLCQKCQDKVLS